MVKVLDYIGTVSRQGRMRVIVIPKRLHPKLEGMEGKQVRVIVDDFLP